MWRTEVLPYKRKYLHKIHAIKNHLDKPVPPAARVEAPAPARVPAPAPAIPEVAAKPKCVELEMSWEELKQEPKAPNIPYKVEEVKKIEEAKPALAPMRSASMKMCVVCYASPINTVVYKCGHSFACKDCIEGIKRTNNKCAICRAKIIDIIPLHSA